MQKTADQGSKLEKPSVKKKLNKIIEETKLRDNKEKTEVQKIKPNIHKEVSKKKKVKDKSL